MADANFIGFASNSAPSLSANVVGYYGTAAGAEQGWTHLVLLELYKANLNLVASNVSGLGTMATQNANAVAITGGSVVGITDLAVADGGTGASNASAARTNLGISTVGNTGAYSDLSGLPTLGTAAATNSNEYATAAQGLLAASAVQPGSLANVATTGQYADLSGTPTIPNAIFSTLVVAGQDNVVAAGPTDALTVVAGGNVTVTTNATTKTITIAAAGGGGGAGTVTSVNGDGSTTGLTVSGGPITNTGTLTLGGVLVVAHGGTGANTHTAQSLLVGNGTGAFASLAPGTSGNVVTSNGTAWLSQAPSAPSGGGTLTLARFTALDNQPPAANYATFDTRNSIAVLDCDANVAEAAIFVGIMPEGADFTTGVSVRVAWMATSATSGNCVWTSAFERGNTDLDADSFANAISNTSAASATSGIPSLAVMNHSGSEIDGIVAGELFRVRITRDAANGSDDMAGDAEFIAVELRQRE